MKPIKNEIDKLVYDEYGDMLNKKDKKIEKQANEIKTQANEITKLNNTNQEYKNKLKQLNELKDLTPEAKKIIHTMMLL